MAEIDPVILQLRADMNQYLSTLRSTTANVDRLLGTQEKRVKQLETQIRQSSGQISATLKGLAASFAGAFSAQQIGQIVDSYTRLQNALKVAGLEGAALGQVQERLVEIGSRYGVSVNALADLYGKNAQTAQELGASQGQLLQITEATSQALLISGTGAAQAQGAILGLSQALASGTVRAEEFNQINEGGLRPLLQAAAASERWGGSVAKLRNDVLAGKVSSQEFFAAILAGSKQLEEQAGRATLTLAGAFTSLSNQLTIYVGEASAANGATAAVAIGIQALAENLDTVITALSIVGAALVGRYAAGLVVSATAAMRASAAATALAAAQVGVAGTAGTAAFAVGRLTASMLAMLGGAPGIAITGIALALGFLATQTSKASIAADELRASIADQAKTFKTTADDIRRANAETGNLTEAEKSALVATANLTGEAHKLADAWARVAAEAKAAAIANAEAALDTARTNRIKAEGAVRRENPTTKSALTSLYGPLFGKADQNADISGFPSASRLAPNANRPSPFLQNNRLASPSNLALNQARLNEEAAKKNVAQIKQRGLESFRAQNTGAGGGGSGRTRGGSGSSGPSAAEIEARYNEEMRRLEQEELRARYDLTDTAEERADLEKDILAAERASRIAAIEADKDFTRAQKDAQIAALNRIYGEPAKVGPDGEVISEGRPGLAAQRINRDLERQQNDLALNQLEAQAATLDAQIEIETNTKKRQGLERKALALRQKIERARLEEGIATGRIAASTRKELAAQQAIERQKLDRAQRSPGQVFRDDLREQADNINDAVESIQIKGLQSLNDGLTEAIMGTKSLGDVFKNVANQIIADLLRIAIQRAIIEPLAGMLFGGGGSIGGAASSIGSGIGSLFGRASGGYVAPGQMVRVNEGASPGRVEAFMSRDGGQIIPLGRMNALQPGNAGGGTATVRVELSGDIDGRIQAISGDVAVQVVKASAPALIDASARETMARAGRPRM